MVRKRDIEYYEQRRRELDQVLADPELSWLLRHNLERARDFCTRRIRELENRMAILEIIRQN
jgi:hypothetical protein